MIRNLKIAASALIGLMGLLFFVGNGFNASAAFGGVSYVISGAEQPYYKIFGPTFSDPWAAWAGLAVIMAGELAVGVLGACGAWRMLRQRSARAEVFREARTMAIAAGAMGMLVWYGAFIVLGEGYFYMWTEASLRSVEGAFRYGSVCAALMFFIASGDDELLPAQASREVMP